MSLRCRTRAESSGFRETSLHADVMAFVEALADRRDPRLHVTSFGVSPQGRSLPLLVLSPDGVQTPAQARATGRPVVLVVEKDSLSKTLLIQHLSKLEMWMK